ncbi:uncharacterized protein LOC109538243 [Dendroctonus ponderosae]|uniref:uncharacterized protein LOC109538243 n=1 Tax=Dendroctonus ponderosae TaxID=77166 RepID=UPI0020357296|nr:uncharacterized protein LOC109538243 [Dendroctonus ponderosae]
MVDDTVTLTCRDGLAFIVGSSAGPAPIFRSYAWYHGATQSGTNTPTQYSIAHPQFVWWYHRRKQNRDKRFSRMEKSRSDPHQQFVAQQNGQRYQKAVRKCRNLHHLGTPDWSGYRCDWLLAFRQLLVSGPGNRRSSGGLTPATKPSKAWRVPQPPRPRRCGRGYGRGGRKLLTWGPIFESRERLASRRGIRKRCPKPLTSRSVRKKRRCGDG